jgi:hypothetical protein
MYEQFKSVPILEHSYAIPEYREEFGNGVVLCGTTGVLVFHLSEESVKLLAS